MLLSHEDAAKYLYAYCKERGEYTTCTSYGRREVMHTLKLAVAVHVHVLVF